MHKSQFQKIDPYDWFCAPGSQLDHFYNKKDLLAASQIHQVELSTEFLLRLHVLLLDVDQEDAVTARAVLIHI